MLCKNCGNDLLETVKFCPNCGSKVEEDLVSAVTNVVENGVTDSVENVVEPVMEVSSETTEVVIEAENVVTEAVITEPEETVEEVVEKTEAIPVVSDVVSDTPIAEPVSVEPIVETPVEEAQVAEPVVESPVTEIKDEGVAVAASSLASAVAENTVISKIQEAPMSENVTTTEVKNEVKSEVKNEVKPSRKAIKDKKNYEKNAKKQAVIDSLPAEYKPVSVSTYFWLTVLAAIPCIGFIFSIILSFSGRNKNRKNFMKAIFVWYIIGIILALIAALVITFAFPDSMSTIIDGVADLLIDLGIA